MFLGGSSPPSVTTKQQEMERLEVGKTYRGVSGAGEVAITINRRTEKSVWIDICMDNDTYMDKDKRLRIHTQNFGKEYEMIRYHYWEVFATDGHPGEHQEMVIPGRPIKPSLFKKRSSISTMFFWNREATLALQGDMPLKEFMESDMMVEAYHAKYEWFGRLKEPQREYLRNTHPELNTWTGMREVWKKHYSTGQ